MRWPKHTLLLRYHKVANMQSSASLPSSSATLTAATKQLMSSDFRGYHMATSLMFCDSLNFNPEMPGQAGQSLVQTDVLQESLNSINGLEGSKSTIAPTPTRYQRLHVRY